METTRYLSEVLKVFNLNRQETKAVQTKAVLFQLTIMVIEKKPKKETQFAGPEADFEGTNQENKFSLFQCTQTIRLHVIMIQYYLICINKTWLVPEKKQTLFFIPDYTILRNDLRATKIEGKNMCIYRYETRHLFCQTKL